MYSTSAVYGNGQAKKLIGDLRGLSYIRFQVISHPRSFGSSRSTHRTVGFCHHDQQSSESIPRRSVPSLASGDGSKTRRTGQTNGRITRSRYSSAAREQPHARLETDWGKNIRGCTHPTPLVQPSKGKEPILPGDSDPSADDELSSGSSPLPDSLIRATVGVL